eukprot:6196394-Pleurochrysis_carterae.AAC.1
MQLPQRLRKLLQKVRLASVRCGQYLLCGSQGAYYFRDGRHRPCTAHTRNAVLRSRSDELSKGTVLCSAL